MFIDLHRYTSARLHEVTVMVTAITEFSDREDGKGCRVTIDRAHEPVISVSESRAEIKRAIANTMGFGIMRSYSTEEDELPPPSGETANDLDASAMVNREGDVTEATASGATQGRKPRGRPAGVDPNAPETNTADTDGTGQPNANTDLNSGG